MSALTNTPNPVQRIEMPYSDQKGECSICLDKFKAADLLSGHDKHLFHKDCLGPWVETHNHCPLCRAPFEGAPAERSLADEGRRVTRGSVDEALSHLIAQVITRILFVDFFMNRAFCLCANSPQTEAYPRFVRYNIIVRLIPPEFYP